MSNLALVPPQVTRAATFWRENEHAIVIGMMVISGVAAVGLAVAFVHAVRIGAPLALKVAAAKYLPAAAVVAV